MYGNYFYFIYYKDMFLLELEVIRMVVEYRGYYIDVLGKKDFIEKLKYIFYEFNKEFYIEEEYYVVILKD